MYDFTTTQRLDKHDVEEFDSIASLEKTSRAASLPAATLQGNVPLLDVHVKVRLMCEPLRYDVPRLRLAVDTVDGPTWHRVWRV